MLTYFRNDSTLRLYGSPGGKLELGESFEECAQRELKEELNLDLEMNHIKYLTTLNVIIKEEGVHWVNIFMATVIDEK